MDRELVSKPPPLTVMYSFQEDHGDACCYNLLQFGNKTLTSGHNEKIKGHFQFTDHYKNRKESHTVA